MTNDALMKDAIRNGNLIRRLDCLVQAWTVPVQGSEEVATGGTPRKRTAVGNRLDSFDRYADTRRDEISFAPAMQ